MFSKRLVIFLIIAFSALAFVWSYRFMPQNIIRVVGSSTVYPFVSSVSESYHVATSERTPIVEHNGTVGGIQIFCKEKGPNSPDILNASRVIYPSEQMLCKKNGVEDIQGFRIGYDGIIFASSNQTKSIYSFTNHDLFLALSARVPKEGKLVKNFYQNWKEINPNLPDLPIKVYGPPSTSGTRDVFIEQMITKTCIYLSEAIQQYPQQYDRIRECKSLREDGKYLEIGENDNVAVQKIENNPTSFAIFGYSYYDQNRSRIVAHQIGDFAPTSANIIKGVYPLGRPLFVYFKRSRLEEKPELKKFLKFLIRDETIGSSGYLIDKGLIPLTDEERVDTQRGMEPLLE
ncbi:MAG: substrate-binding domain-containing protein [Alphaproteobacteria bacterium]|nr:substrate-binding domain-containing protein [Alphaproteobacteria bacterium]